MDFQQHPKIRIEGRWCERIEIFSRNLACDFPLADTPFVYYSPVATSLFTTGDSAGRFAVLGLVGPLVPPIFIAGLLLIGATLQSFSSPGFVRGSRSGNYCSFDGHYCHNMRWQSPVLIDCAFDTSWVLQLIASCPDFGILEAPLSFN